MITPDNKGIMLQSYQAGSCPRKGNETMLNYTTNPMDFYRYPLPHGVKSETVTAESIGNHAGLNALIESIARIDHTKAENRNYCIGSTQQVNIGWHCLMLTASGEWSSSYQQAIQHLLECGNQTACHIFGHHFYTAGNIAPKSAIVEFLESLRETSPTKIKLNAAKTLRMR